MGVDEPFGFRLQAFEFLFSVVLDLLERRRVINLPAFLKDRNHDLPGIVRGFVGFFQIVIHGMVRGHWNPFGDRFIHFGEKVSHHAAFHVVKPDNLLDSRIGHLFRVLGYLDLGNQFPVSPVCGHEFVHHAQRRCLVGCHQLGADAPDIDARPLVPEGFDQPLIQVAARKDLHFREPGLIQHVTGNLGIIGEVPAVDPDASQGFAVFAHFFRHPDGVAHAVGYLVSIDKQNAVVRKDL